MILFALQYTSSQFQDYLKNCPMHQLIDDLKDTIRSISSIKKFDSSSLGSTQLEAMAFLLGLASRKAVGKELSKLNSFFVLNLYH